MYWSDFVYGMIQRADLDGSNDEELIITGVTPFGIALDPAAGKMYWTDIGSDKIQRADLDGSNVEDLVTTDLRNPRGIALDPAAGKMYWSVRDVSTFKIQRADLDGTGVEDVVTSLSSFVFFIALALPRPDADADGVMDECDGCPNDPTKTVPGICGCGIADTDTDGDGTPDCFDQCPNDPAKVATGFCGCGTPDSLDDGDGDGIIDCLDNCPITANANQADGNGNGVGDACETPSAGPFCGGGMNGMLVIPMTLIGIGWMRRRRPRVRRSSRFGWERKQEEINR